MTESYNTRPGRLAALRALSAAELAEASDLLTRRMREHRCQPGTGCAGGGLDVDQLQQDGAQDPDGAWSSYAGLSPLEQRHLDGDR